MNSSKLSLTLSGIGVKSGSSGAPNLAIVPKLALLAGDLLVFVLIFYLLRGPFLAAPILFLSGPPNAEATWSEVGADWFAVPAIGSCIYYLLAGHYSRRRVLWEDTRQIVIDSFVWCLIDLVVMSGTPRPHQHSLILLTWILAIVALPLMRYLVKRLLILIQIWQVPTVIVGSGPNAVQTYSMFRSEPLLGFSCVLFLELADSEGDDIARAPPMVVNGESVPMLRASTGASGLTSLLGNMHVVVATEDSDLTGIQPLIGRLSKAPLSMHIVPPMRGVPLYGMDVQHIFGREPMLLQVRNNLSRRSMRLIKRSVDLILSSALIALLSPLFAILAWRTLAEDGRPVFYIQERVGLSGKPFGCIKFRSMIRNAEAVLDRWRTEQPEVYEEYLRRRKLRNDARITRNGRFLRSYSLDELPQLFNVLKGDMSLIGPRPLLAREIEEYGDRIAYYTQVRPGISGLWQISGRSDTTLKERAYFDEWYIKNWSLWYDTVILLKTLPEVFARRGAH